MFKKILFISLLCLIFISSVANAGSIWSRRNTEKKSLYADDTARQIGDILTIIIEETHKTDNKVSRDLNNETTRTAGFDGQLGITTENSNFLPRMPGFTMNATTKRELKGQSDFKDERTTTDRITVVVEDVLANGNLIVIGTRMRKIAGDTQTIQVSGIVRPSDIDYGNTVKSSQIANFKLVTVNDGVSDKYNEPGWLGKIFDALWPF